MIEIRRKFRMSKGFKTVDPLDGYVFTPESNAHRFIVECVDLVDGQETVVPFEAGSTVHARFLKADHVTELVDGSLDTDGAAVVTLPAECYAVPGRFLLTILVTTGSTKICVFAGAGTVLEADSTDVNISSNTARSVDQKIAEIDNATDAAEAAVSQVNSAISAGSAKITEINQAAAAARASIPQDYTALSDSVGDLKSALYFQIDGTYETKQNHYFFRGSQTKYGVDSTSAMNRITISNGPTYVTSGGPDLIILDTDVTISHTNFETYRIGLATFANSGAVENWIGWLSEPYTVPANTLFKFMVKRADEGELPADFASDPCYTGLSMSVSGNFDVSPKAYYPVKIVSKDGSSEFSTIQSAVDAAKDGDIIYVKSGWYEETVINTKQIAIVGQDKYSTVLYNTTGEYATPPLWTCSGRLENITVYAWNENGVSLDSISNLGYALHLDQKWDSVHSRRHIEIKNCVFKSDFGDCIGCGIDEDGYIEISDTICEATHKSGMKVHPFPIAGGTSKILLKNNVFKKGADDNAYGLMFHTGGTDNVNFNTVQVEAYNNIAKTYDGWNTNCFFMGDYNYGNTLAGMNRFSLS